MAYTTVSLRQSDRKALGNNPRLMLERAADAWRKLTPNEKQNYRNASDRYDYTLRASKKALSNPLQPFSMSFTSSTWQCIVDAGGDKNGRRVSAGLRVLCRMLGSKNTRETVDALNPEKLVWSTVSIGLQDSVQLRNKVPMLMEAGRFMGKALEVWDALPVPLRDNYIRTAVVTDWERRQPDINNHRDSVVPFNAPLTSGQWVQLYNIGSHNKSRGARTVIRAFLLALDAT